MDSDAILLIVLAAAIGFMFWMFQRAITRRDKLRDAAQEKRDKENERKAAEERQKAAEQAEELDRRQEERFRQLATRSYVEKGYTDATGTLVKEIARSIKRKNICNGELDEPMKIFRQAEEARRRYYRKQDAEDIAAGN